MYVLLTKAGVPKCFNPVLVCYIFFLFVSFFFFFFFFGSLTPCLCRSKRLVVFESCIVGCNAIFFSVCLSFSLFLVDSTPLFL